VRVAIDLYDETRAKTSEISDVEADRCLASKTVTIDLAIPETPPQTRLSNCHFASQLPRPIGE